jgi:MFS family permease
MTAAALGDRFGWRRLFIAGLALFTGAPAACALAPSIGWLIAARSVQGAGSAMIMPHALALLARRYRLSVGRAHSASSVISLASPPWPDLLSAGRWSRT